VASAGHGFRNLFPETALVPLYRRLRMRHKSLLWITLLIWNALPAEAARPLAVGDRVLVSGEHHRKCSARVESLPSPGYARLAFDRARCGDGAVPYAVKHLQHLQFAEAAHGLHRGDAVIVKGHFDNDCSGHVREISRSGYVAVDLDSLLCADTEALFKAKDLRKASFVDEAALDDRKFTVGQKVAVPGIHQGESCRGEIRRLTNDGLAEVDLDGLTCAYGGKLYSLDQLHVVRAPAPRRHVSGAMIFERVMREIASQKKKSKKRAGL
jgi:hypothetical protein